jgi:hypothetical protein
MIGMILKLVSGPLVKVLMDLYKGYNQRQVTEAQLRRDLEKAVLSTFEEVAKTQGDVIMAEMRGENWLQRNWRPMVATGFAFIVFFYGLLMPVLVAWFGFPPVRIGDMLLEWIKDIVIICLGGYIGFRSLEKIVGMFSGFRK